ncbi:MAG: 6-bladed beta-propeller [Draconibacterium sp.]|nr:6-bladed beta-propeller [Draconibacterium sp.]
MKVICIIILFMVILSCSQKKAPVNNQIIQNRLIEIVVSDDLINSDIDYSNILDSIEFVKLETNKHCLIGNIRKIRHINDRFYILDKNQIIYIFDSKGKFLKKLDKRGKGPKEYYELRDFDVNMEGTITILSNRKVVVYDSNLRFLNAEKIKIKSELGRSLNPIHFLPLESNTFFYSGSFGLYNSFNQEYALCNTNKKYKRIKEFFPVKYNYTMGHQNFYKSNNKIYFTNTYGNDTIYQIHESKVEPRIIVNFLGSKVTEKNMMEERATFFQKVWDNNLNGNIMKVYENDHFLCFKFTSGKIPKQVVYNIKTKDLKIINIVQSVPIPFLFIDGCIDDHFFSVLDAYILKDIISKGYTSNIMEKNGLSNIKESDNPIIVKFKFNF